MHTTPTTPTLADLNQTMIRVQIAALETLERCMTDPESTGNEKTDKAKSTERNRQRMAAAQALIHCRTMFRELRERREQSHRIRQDERQASKKAIYERAHLRRLHRQYPGEYDDPDAPSTSRAPEGSGFLPPSPLEGEGGRRSQSVGRMRGSSEPPNPQSAPPTKPIPTPVGRSLAAQIIALAGSNQSLS